MRDALQSIRFGTVSLVLQDGRVIQVDKSEKIRINRAGFASSFHLFQHTRECCRGGGESPPFSLNQ